MMSEWDDAILIGVVARTHGNRGEVIVNAETDFPEARFREGAQLMTRRKDGTPATLEVATMRMHQGRPVILFTGVELDERRGVTGRTGTADRRG
jgi:16S rRNA processing protein RimM